MAQKNTKKPSKNAPKKAAAATRDLALEPGVEGAFKIVLYKHLRFKMADQSAPTTQQLITQELRGEARVVQSGALKPEAGKHSLDIVEAHIAARGGELVCGWSVVEFDGLYLEAIPHAVWRDEDGQLVDLSASPLKESLFVEGPQRPEDGPMPDRFMQLSAHPYVTAWLHLRREEDAFQERCYEGDEYNGEPLSLRDYFNWRLNFEAQDPEVPTLKDFLLMNVIFIQHQLSAAADARQETPTSA